MERHGSGPDPVADRLTEHDQLSPLGLDDPADAISSQVEVVPEEEDGRPDRAVERTPQHAGGHRGVPDGTMVTGRVDRCATWVLVLPSSCSG